jgi:hypothetical protein
MDEWIPFHPTEMDVVATKIRTWNSRHPGNQFYTDVVQEIIQNTSSTWENASDFRYAAEQVHRIICMERGGRFLKLPDGVSDAVVCTVMSEQDVINKVIHALKTAKKRKELRDAGIIPPPFVKAAQCGLQPFKVNPQKPRPAKTSHITDVGIADDELFTSTPLPKRKHSSSGNTNRSKDNDSPNITSTTIQRPQKRLEVAYEAVGPLGIDAYALKLISRVCSQPGDPRKAHYCLDRPDVKDYTVHNEPDKERFMRLQLRQRFASAIAVGLTPIEFARKLLKLWGGELRQVNTDVLPTPTVSKAATIPKKQSMTTLVETATEIKAAEDTSQSTLSHLQRNTIELLRPVSNATTIHSRQSETTLLDAAPAAVAIEVTSHSTTLSHLQHNSTAPPSTDVDAATMVDNHGSATLSSHEEAAMTNDMERKDAAVESSVVAAPVAAPAPAPVNHDTTSPATANPNPSTMINL